MSDGIVVLGMHRSGTSLVSEALHRWGAFGRVKECLPSDQWNAHGYWEYSPLVDFNDRLLQKVGATWSFPPSPSEDEHLADLAHQPSYRDGAIKLLASMQTQNKGKWFWKDPRLSLLLPFWQEIWGDVHYIICVRDPIEICLSLQKRDDFSFPISILLWQRYMLSVLEWTRNAPTIAILYSNMLQNPATECARLSNFLLEAPGPDPSLGSNAEMAKAVDRTLQHCAFARRQSPATLTQNQKEIQEILERFVDRGVAFAHPNLNRCSLPFAWRTSLRGHLFLRRCQRFWDRAEQGAIADPKSDKLTKDLFSLAMHEWHRW